MLGRAAALLLIALGPGPALVLWPMLAWAGQWRLLTPPVSASPGGSRAATAQSGLPLRDWVLQESYPSATECERGKSRNLLTETEILIEAKGRPDESLARARWSAASLGRWVASEDLPTR